MSAYSHSPSNKQEKETYANGCSGWHCEGIYWGRSMSVKKSCKFPSLSQPLTSI